MIPHSVAISIAVLVAVSSALPQAVSPVSRGSVEGNSSTTYPLGRFDARVQQLHADLPASLTTINGHSYRRDAISTRGTVSGYQCDLEITLSVAANAPQSASRTFADNRGTNVVTVMPRSTISFPSTSRPATDPAPAFDLVIPYTAPFTRPNGAAVCLEIVMHGNQTSSGSNRNFTPYIDAHALRTDGVAEQPGFRFGTGCSTGSGSAHTARFEFLRNSNDLTLDIQSRDGVPTTSSSGPSEMLMIVGLTDDNAPWSWLPSCTLWASYDIILNLPGPTDAQGDWNGTLTGLANMPEGLRFTCQLVSGNVSTGELTFSDGSWVTTPVMDPATLPAVRIAAGSDRNATSGTVSTSVPVTMFF